MKINEDYYRAAPIRHLIIAYTYKNCSEFRIKNVSLKYEVIENPIEADWYYDGAIVECTIEFEKSPRKECIKTLKNFLNSALLNYVRASASEYYKKVSMEVIEYDFLEKRLAKANYSMDPDPDKDDLTGKTRFTAKFVLEPSKGV